MYLVDILRRGLEYLGLINKSRKLVFLGIYNVGKTSLLHVLKDDEMIITEPTLHPTVRELTIGNISFTTYDTGSHNHARKLWAGYFLEVDGIVFVIDASALEYMDEAKMELDRVLTNEVAAHLPVLVLGNKTDRRDAVSEPQLFELLQLRTTGKVQVPRDSLDGARPLELFMCSVLKKEGYQEGLQWLSQYMN